MENSLSRMRPHLVSEWSDKNLPLTPDTVTFGSNKIVWWKGACGHEWTASVKSRTVNGTGCPYCSHNFVPPGFNDLASRFPEIAAEWSERNLPLTPDQVTAFKNIKVWWKCHLGHEWNTLISTRAGGSQCPYCSGIKLLKGFNDLQTKFPSLAIEWSDKNLPLTPDAVNEKSTKNVWWKCRTCGYEWKAVVKARVKGGMCPVCAERAVLQGYNDLGTTDPHLLSEWDYEKNSKWTPSNVSRNSMKVVTVTKSDREEGTAQGDAKLSGAVYGIYKGETLVDKYVTDSDGQFTTKEYVCDSDWTVREITPSEGYLLDKTVHKVGAEPKLFTIEHNLVSNDVTEQVMKGNIAIIKHTDDGETKIETPESGATFEIYLKSSGSFEAAEEDERDTVVCDENGFAQTKDKSIE